MALATVSQFLDALGQHGLLKAYQLDEARRQQAADPRNLARTLIEKGWLTPFQVNQLLQGRGDELVLGQYLLLERIGEGGMGQVFKARHRTMDRLVALKLIRKERLTKPDNVKRFHREIQAAAQLTHPNIVHAYDAAQVGSTHFFAMEFVPGTDLGKLLKERGPLPIDEACEYVRQAALGLAHAHEKGMVHRDIKPQNLLLARTGTPGSGPGTVKILDLGLARFTPLTDPDGETKTELTQEGSVMGTPDYIAPEQAQESHTTDIRGDIYSLGCTLYFLLTGGPPFPGGSLAQKLAWHMYTEPVPIEKRRAGLPEGLVQVLRKMMAKRPEARYQTPAEAAVALVPWCPTTTPLAIPVSMASIGGNSERITADLPPQGCLAPVASLAPPEVSAPLAVALPVAQVAAESFTSPQLPETLASHAPIAESVRLPRLRMDRRGWLLASGVGCIFLTMSLCLLVGIPGRWTRPTGTTSKEGASKILPEDRFDWQPEGLVMVLGEHRLRHNPEILCMALSSDGKMAATGSKNNTIRLVDAETLRERRQLLTHLNIDLSALAFSRNGKLLVSGSHDKTVRLWDADSGKELYKFDGHEGPVECVAISPDAQRILSGGWDKTVRVWDVPSRKEIYCFTKHTTPVRSVLLSRDGRLAYSAGGSNPNNVARTDCAIRVWEVETGKERQSWEAHGNTITSMVATEDGKRVLSSSLDRNCILWDAESGKLIRALDRKSEQPSVVAIAPDGKSALVPIRNSPTGLWELESGRELRKIPIVDSSGVAFFPDGRRALLTSGNTLRIWDTVSDKELRPFIGHTGSVSQVVFSQDGRYLLSGGANQVLLWDLTSGNTLRAFHGPTSLSAIAISPNNAYVAGSTATGDVTYLWERETGREIRKLTGSAYATSFFSPDSRRLMISHGDTVRQWDVASGKEINQLPGHKGTVPQLGYFPDGQRAYTFDGNLLRWWDVNSGKEVRRLTVSANCPTFSANGQLLFTGGTDGTVSRWDLTEIEPKPQTFFKLHTAAVVAIALAPDGSTLFSAGADNRVIEWEPTTGQKIREWQQPGGVNGLAISPDGKFLATANGNTTVYILRVGSGSSTAGK